MANNPNLEMEDEGDDVDGGSETNKRIETRFEFVATKAIISRDTISL